MRLEDCQDARSQQDNGIAMREDGRLKLVARQHPERLYLQQGLPAVAV
jgi:hypothetical protein